MLGNEIDEDGDEITEFAISNNKGLFSQVFEKFIKTKELLLRGSKVKVANVSLTGILEMRLVEISPRNDFHSLQEPD